MTDTRIEIPPVVTTSAEYDLRIEKQETETPDLMAVLSGRAHPEVDAAAIDALIAWSLDPEAVSPEEADRLRAEAWGYDPTE
jgi:hypothetical protein